MEEKDERKELSKERKAMKEYAESWQWVSIGMKIGLGMFIVLPLLLFAMGIFMFIFFGSLGSMV